MHSSNANKLNLEKFKLLFPSCVTEAKDEAGNIKELIDLDLFSQEFSDVIIDGSTERYQLNWPGKREALLLSNSYIAKTLIPVRKDSVNFDASKNIFIEGDNLDALKLLQETYLGKIKLIYIDPPYNTGNDLLYEDDFTESIDEFLLKSSQKDESDIRLVANTESNGRFHSDWLSMIYPRLRLAKNLLTEDGAICISIDDNEVDNLRKICCEVFGEKNFIACIANTNNPKGRSDDKFIATAHEYIVIYAKNVDQFIAYGFEPGEEIIKRYNKKDSEGRIYREIDLRKTGDSDLREDRPKLFYFFHYNEQTGELIPSRDEDAPFGYISIKPIRADGRDGNWRWGLDTAKNQLNLLHAKFMPNRNIWGVLEKDFLEGRNRVKATSSWTFKDVNSERGSEEFIDLGFDKRVFPKPKPLGTIRRLIEVCCAPSSSDTIMDFFAGSGTTAQAVMQLNELDGGSRKYILVQFPEKCGEDSEAFKSGFKHISEITKERIRRANELIFKDHKSGITSEKSGFRAFKIDSSNMADVYYSPDLVTQDLLGGQANNVKIGRTPEDLLFQVLLEWGVDLALPICKEVLQGRDVYYVDQNALAACFDDSGGIDEDFVKELAKRRPLRVVFRDAGFKSDSVKINVEQIFKLMSPSTEVKCI